MELSTIGLGIIYGDYNHYNFEFTIHGIIMIFIFIVPLFLGGLANWAIPILISVPDLLFPRLNALSLAMYVSSSAIWASLVLQEEGFAVGWTMYAPLVCSTDAPGSVIDGSIMILMFNIIASVVNSINMTATVFSSINRQGNWISQPLIVITAVTAGIALGTFAPALLAGLTNVCFDRTFSTNFYTSDGGGDPLMYQHLFWLLGHPEVYLIILPVMGWVSSLMSEVAGSFIINQISLVCSVYSITIIGSCVWGHHMFVTSIDANTKLYYGAVSLIVALPTSIKVFGWLYSLIQLPPVPEIQCVYMFLSTFIMGGMSGLLLANSGLDTIVHETYFVIAHFHYVMALSAIYGGLMAYHRATSIWTGLESNLVHVQIWLLLLSIGSFLVFLPLHREEPRRTWTSGLSPWGEVRRGV